jgi:predicted DNA-binding transcriptional regulator AlpA
MKEAKIKHRNQDVVDRLVTPDDLAHMFQVTRRTLSRWCAAGRIPAPVKLGGLLRWKANQIHRFIENL